MIIHKLIAHHLWHKDDAHFYLLQAQDAIRWMERNGVVLSKGAEVLDLGCGHGIFGAELLKRGCSVLFADESNFLLPELRASQFQVINIDKEGLAKLGKYDLVICSNVLEHLSEPQKFIASIADILKPDGKMYLSWTNWLSPWGGHEFSPFHYFGPRRGHLIFDHLTKKSRIHTPFENLFPTHIGSVLSQIKSRPELSLLKIVPRYYPEFRFLTRIPLVREFLTWNTALLIGKGEKT